ncbi:hypothetical protein TIFTF001_021356 [Ficus carica]|uniref:Uncharacterized protein n=1 Tax=Ficus carica TaxID=3494 RepID=A0AA88AHT6_FICCA|nr:hypothetical protein TIFTF001_021356 [Ficus carica]
MMERIEKCSRRARGTSRTQEEVAKAYEECEERTTRRERTWTTQRNKSREDRSSKREQKCSLSPPKYALSINPSDLVTHLKGRDYVTWPKKLPDNFARDMTKYCKFLKDHSHNTIDCRALRAKISELLKKGHLSEFLSKKGRETYGLDNEPKSEGLCSRSKTHHHYRLFGSPSVSFAGVRCLAETQ